MASRDAATADKIIVDRRKSSRNRDLTRVVRVARTRLSESTNPRELDREMLFVHARTILRIFPFIVLAAFSIMAWSIYHSLDPEFAIWPALAILTYGALAWTARRLHKTDADRFRVETWQSFFLAAHALTGISWTFLTIIDCDSCGSDPSRVIQTLILVLAMAATAVIFSALREATFITFILPVAVYVIANTQTLSHPLIAGTAIVLLATLGFSAFIASRFNVFHTIALTLQTEKDALLADLETASSMSDEARLRAEEANLAKSRFLASMSHELRTPLNAILGFSEVMSKEVLGPLNNDTYREYAADIHKSGEHLLNLINEILDLSRVEAGRYMIEEKPLMLPDIALECIRMMQMKARSKDLTILPQFERAMQPLLCDERSIRQIMLNLLSNAVKFTPSGGEIRFRIGWTAGGGQYISIRDNGPGIPADEIPVVLSAFGQGTIAIKSAEQGAGLGLPIVQALVKMHGGEFQLHSKLREGTEALAIFPPARVVDEVVRSPSKKLRAQAA